MNPLRSLRAVTPGRRILRSRGFAATAVSLLALGAVTALAIPASATARSNGTWEPPATYNILSDASPAGAADPDTRSVELGVRFITQTDGWITAVRYYKFAEAAASDRATLWSGDGDLLARADFDSPGVSGWQIATLDKAVAVSAGNAYAASYTAPKGRYAADPYSLSDSRTIRKYGLTALKGVYSYDLSFPTRSWNDANYFADVVFTSENPGSVVPTTVRPTTAPPVVTTTQAPPLTTTAPPTTATPVAPTTQAPPVKTTAPPPVVTTTQAPPATTTTSPPSGGFPGSANTGIPTGTSLSTYTGPCTITAANTVIDAKTVNCSLSIRAAGVQISRSKINGSVVTGGGSFTLTDSEVDAGGSGSATGVGDSNYTVLRTEIYGGNRGGNCEHDCLIQDSWIHGQVVPSTSASHSSGLRASQDTVFRHNTIACDARDNSNGGGCSAAVTMYGDYAPVQRVTVENNLMKAGSGGYCSYGGSSAGKPYSSGASNIVYRNNVYERGSNGKCGTWGAITAFDPSRPGNVWSGNTWDNGGTVASAN